MAKIALKYIGPSALIQVGTEFVKRGATISIDADLAEALLNQGCSFVPKVDSEGKPVVDRGGAQIVDRVEVDPQWKRSRKAAAGGGDNNE